METQAYKTPASAATSARYVAAMKPALATVSPPSSDETLESQLTAMRQREVANQRSIWQAPVADVSITKPVTISIEHQIAALIVRPIEPGEGHRTGNDRKERELLMLLETLTAVEALTLRRRLACSRPDDALAMAFGRLVVERRTRVLAFLDDTRRGIALRQRT